MTRRTTSASFFLVLVAALVLALVWRQPIQQYDKNIVSLGDGYNGSFSHHLTAVQSQSQYSKRLQKRALLDECHTRGCGLMRYCQSQTLQDDKQTVFTEYSQIGQYGWEKQDSDKDADEEASTHGALQALGLPTVDDQSWIKWKWANTVEIMEAGKPYEPSNAYYVNIYNPTHGALLAVDNHAPKDTSELTSEEWTPLYRWSDIVALTWVNLATSATQVQGLRYIIRVNIVNDDTIECITAFMPGGDIKNLPQYPGLEFDASSDAGLTLLGSPNGNGVGWFLAQHKAKLGGTKQVTKIRVWETSDPSDPFDVGSTPCMLFELADTAP